MRLVRLADLFVVKYKFAESSATVEGDLRQKINLLWNIPNKTFNILKACAESEASKPKNSREQMAVEGFRFCRDLLAMINYLKINILNISLGEMREVLLNIVNLIDSNKNIKVSDKGKLSGKGEPVEGQFPHVSELITEMIPLANRSDLKKKQDLYSKARTGLSRILSLSNTMLDELKRLEVMVPEKFTHETITDVDINQENPSRFTPQRRSLNTHDLIDFIRQYGDDYGIPDREHWELLVRDPEVKERVTTIINALNRGHVPRDSIFAKEEIRKIIEEYKARKVI